MFKVFKLLFKYLVYLPITNLSYWQSLYSVIKYKVLYENKNHITFFDQVSSRNNFSSLLIQELLKKEKIILIVGDKKHIAFKNQNQNQNLIVLFLDQSVIILFKLLKIKFMITFDSGFSPKIKSKDTYIIHLFHSIVSINHIYKNGSFDGYDVFFMVGPHHEKELLDMEKNRNWTNKKYIPIGYPKLDILIKNNNKQIYKKNNQITILFAPSWGNNNILKLEGINIINKVLNLGFNIIVRPHPNSFIYDKLIIQQINEICKINKQCILENSNFALMDSYVTSDLLISDWSGAAYEYAFGLLKPVLFIDTPRKINNNSKVEINKLPMEVVCREKIGKITSMDQFEKNISLILNESNWKEKIKKVRKNYIFNPGNATKVAIEEIYKLRNKYNER